MIQEMTGEEQYDAMKAAVMEVVGTHFRPEFINRVDDVVVFHPLSREHIRLIVDIQLGYLHERLAERDMQISLTEEARDRLAEAGFDPVYGARPLKRAIQQQIENPLANEILQGKFAPGDVIEVGVADSGLQFQNAA
jgi:ATP-dependent Clp protease ATP-binding subunit ClpB